MVKKFWILALVTFLFGLVSNAQKISGSVTDQDGNPLSFSSVYVEEIQKGTSVDFEGKYEIEINQTGTFNIVFSYIGYKSEKRTITFMTESDRELLNIQLKEESSYLEEAIVTGYSVDRRRDLTGTIVKIDAKDITDIPAPSFEAALQGKAAGVQITQGSGMAGSSSIVRIRGIASISAGGDPLYVLDGIPVTDPVFSKILIEYQNAIKTNENLSKDYFINHKDLEISKTTIFLTEEKYKMDNWQLKNIKVKKEEDILFSLLKEGLIRFKLKRISVITSEILARIPLIESEREKKEELNRFSKLTELSRNLHKQVGREC